MPPGDQEIRDRPLGSRAGGDPHPQAPAGPSRGGGRKPYGLTITLGAAVAGLYAGLFLWQDVVTDYFTRGGAYAVLPIVTALAFSVLHGAFTERFWIVLGVDRRGDRRNQREPD